ncbi:MAG: hypothetical protein DWQ36_02945 [Acidobacteria bacterium]|nr:MAG: hypothetical protein DWQ30_02460 [Acidobacteriota bacterium]REK11082.1 MAG: hypothetical protein DWQ36_02945 [Acidobacteriota bacterium]
MQVERYLGEDELERVRSAVAAAEQRTSGEIVTYLVGRCDSYPESPLRAGIVGGAVTLAASMLVFLFAPLWISFSSEAGFALVLAAPVLIGALCAGVCAASERLQRLLLDRSDLEHRVRQRAEAAFLEQEVFATRERTGVLLFLALFERRAVVLADSGIAARLPESAWREVVDELCGGMRRGEVAASLERAVDRVAALLEGAGVERRPDDEQELTDRPTVRER